jgi:hypothetical protein
VRRLIYGIIAGALILTFTAVAFGYPPATISNVTQNSATLSGLDCGTQYQLQLAERNAANTGWESATTQTVTTAACPAAPPTADFSISPDPAIRNQATKFTSTGSCAATPCSYRWLHGDASSTDQIGTGPTATFTYTGTPGPRTVTLEVTDNQNRQATRTRTFQLVEASATPTPTPTSTPTPTPAPTSGFPNASNTGVPSGTTLTPSGGMTINTAGTVVNARDISGPVVVNAPNVTIRNSRIRTNAMWVIENNSTGLLVEDSEILNAPASGQKNCHVGIGSSNFTVRRSEFAGCENAMNIDSPGNITFTDNYVHDLDTTGPSYVWGDEPHTDGIQIGEAAANLTISHNWIDPTPGSGATSAIIMYTGSGTPNSNVRVEDNYLDGRGASYAIYAPRHQTHDVYINRNRMGKGIGYTACVKLGTTVTAFDQNTDLVTGAAISPDNGTGGSCTN